MENTVERGYRVEREEREERGELSREEGKLGRRVERGK